MFSRANTPSGDVTSSSVIRERNTTSDFATGELCPGRPKVRPRTKLQYASNANDGTDDNFSKYYLGSQSHTPGLFTVQCDCTHPNVLGVTVMNCPESLVTALSVLLSRFPLLPKTVYYDNACNLPPSIALRFPWILVSTTPLCYRFHYKSRTFPMGFDPDSYFSLDRHASSRA